MSIIKNSGNSRIETVVDSKNACSFTTNVVVQMFFVHNFENLKSYHPRLKKKKT